MFEKFAENFRGAGDGDSRTRRRVGPSPPHLPAENGVKKEGVRNFPDTPHCKSLIYKAGWIYVSKNPLPETGITRRRHGLDNARLVGVRSSIPYRKNHRSCLFFKQKLPRRGFRGEVVEATAISLRHPTEIRNMTTRTNAQTVTIANPSEPASFRQKAALYAIAKKAGWAASMRETTALDTLTKGQASALIGSQDAGAVLAALGGKPAAKATKAKAKASPKPVVAMTEAPKAKAKAQPKAAPTVEARVAKLESDVAGIASTLAAIAAKLGV